MKPCDSTGYEPESSPNKLFFRKMETRTTQGHEGLRLSLARAALDRHRGGGTGRGAQGAGGRQHRSDLFVDEESRWMQSFGAVFLPEGGSAADAQARMQFPRS